MTQILGDYALIDALRQHPFTEGLGESRIARLASFASEVEFADDELVFATGQPSASCYLLLTGSVAVELCARQFKVCVQVLQGGDLFGWSAFLEAQDTLFQARSWGRTTALQLDGAALAAACKEDLQLAAHLLPRALATAAQRLKATEAKFAEMCGVRV